jgi:hypothetical protein
MTPRQSIERECTVRGRQEVVAGCRALLRGEQIDADLVLALGGPGARPFIDGTARADDYWLRVWGARGLLWAWDANAMDEVREALSDEAWRVREMALKVIARNRVGDLLADAEERRGDPVRRVRLAADRAVARLVARGD